MPVSRAERTTRREDSMHVQQGLRQLVGSLGLAALAVGFIPESAMAGPVKGLAIRDPFRLSATAATTFDINRLSYGINTTGEIGVDALGRGTIGGGFWPRGTGDQYMFNSGLQVTGVIAGAKSPTNPWGGDTTGGKFFDPLGSQKHAEEVTQIVLSYNKDDVDNWPDVANVPSGDAGEDLFDPLLRGRKAASQGDAHWISWEGNPAYIRGRDHPLGILLEHRLLAWNYPSGNEDIIYLIATAYNITSTNPADYEQHRPSIRPILLEKAQDFQALNNAAYNITLPAEGYTIDPFYFAWASDPDVADAGRNASGVNLPFALGFTYVADFASTGGGWIFPPEIFSAPFFPGPGFVAAKYLKSPEGKGEIALFSNNVNGAAGVGDPSPITSLFRWHKGDVPSGCNVASPLTSHVCYIANTSTNGQDVRMMQSAAPGVLGPGQSASIVVAYIQSAAVGLDGYTPTVNQSRDQMYVPAARTLLTNNADSMALRGVHRVDSLTGYRGYVGPRYDHFTGEDGSPDSLPHQPVQTEFLTVPGSLLDKALMAQLIFDNKFLLPFAPANPDFFLIPGDNQVTVLWRPSESEGEGDAYAAVAKSPFLANGVDPNNLYDPNFREFDVEGYRIYRGRLDNPTALQLLTQFDYAGTSMNDYGGNVSTTITDCAPELGQKTKAYGCKVDYPDIIRPGVPSTVKATYDLNGPIIQVLYGQRTLLASGTLMTLKSDTLMSGAVYAAQRGAGGVGYPTLSNTGVPFVFIDKKGNCSSCGVVNGVNYYYTVTAFDVNSLRSGPASLESVRSTKQVTVGSVAANFNNSFTTEPQIVGRSVRTDRDFPILDRDNGRFSKAFPPSNAANISLATFLPELLKGSGSVSLKLDSIGTPVMSTTATTSTADHYYTITPFGSDPIHLKASVVYTLATTSAATEMDSIWGGATQSGVPFTALSFDPSLVSVYGGTQAGYSVGGTWSVKVPRGFYVSTWGRGCAAKVASSTAIPGFFFNQYARCFYNGPRWYSGANETMDNPTGQNPWVYNPTRVPESARRYSNAGELPGVVTAHFPASYAMLAGGTNAQSFGWQAVETALGQFVTAADYSVYWGAGGTVDSVVDLTHDVQIPFRDDMNASWGILNSNSVPQAKRYSGRSALSVTDVSCVWPLKSYIAVNRSSGKGFAVDSVDALGNVLGIPCQTPTSEASNRGAAIPLVRTAVPGPIVFFNDTLDRVKDPAKAPVAPNAGFLLYIKGRVFLMELAGGQVPAAGTVWKLRDYVGVISGGKGDAGDLGPYTFYNTRLPFTAVGAAASFKFDVKNVVEKPTAAALKKIKTVPDPYYVTSAYDLSVTAKTIKFLNVPTGGRIRIYSTAGVLITELINNRAQNDGTVIWNVRNRSNQFVASGPYFWVVESDGAKQVGRMTVINNAQNVN